MTACQALVSATASECGKPLTGVLLDLVAQHVDTDSRFGALRAMRGLALFPSGFGLQLLFQYPGFHEFFFQR